MRRFGLIGFPLGHSFSPTYFSQKFTKEGIIDCIYEAFPLQTINELKPLLEKHPDLVGLNVTIPYKKSVLRFLDEGTEEVKQMIACNCIKISGGRLSGYNTDVTGFELSMAPLLKPHHKKALIFGTGGSASAIEFVLNKLEIEFLFVSRNKKGQKNTITYGEVNKSILNEHTLLINTTPLGMFPHVDQFPSIPYQHISGEHYLFDLVYNPSETMFLRKGKEQGATVKNGSDMLVIQAEESWRIWNDK